MTYENEGFLLKKENRQITKRKRYLKYVIPKRTPENQQGKKAMTVREKRVSLYRGVYRRWIPKDCCITSDV